MNKHSKILMVVGQNDPNPETNSTLRSAIKNAKADGVPSDNIDRILKKLTGGDKDGANFSEQVYEGFGPEGIPMMVTALTDNVKRTFPEVRTAFAKNGGNLGGSGAVAFLFDHVGVVQVKHEGKSEDEMFEYVMESGGNDMEYNVEEGISEVLTEFDQLGAVRDSLEEAGLEVVKFEPQYRAKSPVMVTDEKVAEKLEKLVAAIEDVDDVDEVYVGCEVDTTEEE